MPNMQQLTAAQASPEVPINENFISVEHMAVYAMDPDTTSDLDWGYIGGRWAGFAVTADVLTLTDDDDNYMVVDRTDGTPSVSTSDTNWLDTTGYARVYLITAADGVVTDIEDHRAGPGGVHGSADPPSGGFAAVTQPAEMIAGFIAAPSDKNYKIVVKMAHGGTITEATTISASGTCTATFKINTTALGGTANSVSSSEQSQAHASSNVFAAGDDIVLTVSSNASCADLSFSLKYTRALA